MSTALYGPDFFVGRHDTVVASAEVIVPLIVDELAPLTVVDMGCGKGEWVRALHEHGVAAVGVDISAPDGAAFSKHDLTVPLDLGRRFDVVLSLETGEHLPADAASTYVDTLTRHADTVVFSAAVVGQEGVGHVNCQPHDYWHALFAERGFAVSDPFRPMLAHNDRVRPWYRDNIFLYTRAAG